MKTRVNLTIERNVLEKAKQYAEDVNESLSAIIERHLKTLEKEKKESFMEYVAKLEVPKAESEVDFKKEYYTEKSKKYGF